MRLQQVDELVDRQTGLADLIAQQARSEGIVEGNREGVDRPRLRQDDVAAALASDGPAGFSKTRTASRPEMAGGLGIHRDLDLSALDGQGQALLAAHLQAELDGLPDVAERFRFCLSLAHAAGDDRTFDDEPAVFILVQGYGKLLVLHPIPQIGL
jgi:hypothetical protein